MTAGQQVQIRNAQMVDLMSQDFQHRREAAFAWSRAVAMYQALPGLRAFWPMSSVDYTVANRGIDMSGQSNHLTGNNTPKFGYDSLAPYVKFNGTTQFLSRADGGAGNWADITGGETHIIAAKRGLTIGGWFYLNNAPVGYDVLMSKDSFGGAQRGYYLTISGARQAYFGVSGNGVAIVTTGSTATVSTSNWYFIAGRFIPSTSISVFLNSTRYDNLVGTPVTIFPNTTAFRIGAYGAQYFDGRASMCFLCAAQLSDALILSLYDQTRAMYGR